MRSLLSSIVVALGLVLLAPSRLEAQTIVNNPGVSFVVPLGGDAGAAARAKHKRAGKARRDARARRKAEARTKRRVRTLVAVRRLSRQGAAQRRLASKARSARLRKARLAAAARYRRAAGRMLIRLRKRYAKDKGFQREAETLRRLLRL